MLIFQICVYFFIIFTSYSYGQQIQTTPEAPLQYIKKQRITEILRRDNYGLIEPFFYVSNRPTISEALADEIKNRTLVSPLNHMVYCPTGTDYFSNQRIHMGSVYISAENLPKNGHETNKWFHEAYKYRGLSDPARKNANVTIISATRQNFLQVRCPNTHNHIIVSQAPTYAPIDYDASQVAIEPIKNLRYAEQADINWNLNNYTLPSTIKYNYQKTEMLTTGTLKKQELNTPEDYVNLARKSSNKHGIFIKFLLAIAKVSSNYDPNKTSDEGKRLGITQIPMNILYYYKKNREQAFNPEKAFDFTGTYLKDLSRRYNGNINNVLSAYYLGLEPNNTDAQIIDIPQTQVFVSDIMRYIDSNQPLILN
jgi:hypothetical protein